MKPMPFVTALAVVLLSACSSPSTGSDKRPGFFSVPVPQSAPGTQLGYMSVHVSGFGNDGVTTRADVRLSPGGTGKPRGRLTPIMNVDPQLASRVAVSFKTGQDAQAAYALAKQIARATYCPTGPISENTGIRKYDNPQDLQAILAESKRQGRDVIPSGIRGKSVPATQFRKTGTPTWVVSMKCDAPYPND